MAADKDVSVIISANDAGLNSALQESEAHISTFVESTQSKMQEMADGTKAASAESASALESIVAAATAMGEGVDAGVAAAISGLEGLESRLNSLQKMMGMLSELAVAGFIGRQIIELGTNYADLSEKLSITAQKTGMTTDAIQKLDFAARMAGVSSDQVQAGMIGLARAMAQAENGSKAQTAAFKEVGLSVEQLKSMSLEEVFTKVQDAMAGWADGAEKDALAGRRFLGVGTDLIPLMNQGSQATKQFGDRAAELGTIMDESMIRKGEDAKRSFTELSAVTDMLKMEVGAALVPTLVVLAQSLVDSYKEGGTLKIVLDAVEITVQTLAVLVNTLAGTFTELKIRVEGAIDAVKQWANNVAYAEAAQAGDTTGMKLNTTAINDNTDAKLKAAQAAEDLRNRMIMNPKDYQKGAYQDQTDRLGGAPPNPERTTPTIPQTQNLGKSGGSKSGSESEMGVWREQLQQMEEASNDYFKSHLAEEESFWQSKLALTKTGSKTWYAVEHEIYQVKKQEATQALSEEIGLLREQISEEDRGNLERVVLAQKAADLIAATYGRQSTQYSSAMREVNRNAREYVQEQIKEQDEVIKNQETVSLSAVKVAEEEEKQKFATHREGKKQEITNLIEFENQRLAIEKSAYAQEIAISSNIPSIRKALMAQELKDEAAHDAAVAKLNEEAAVDYQKSWDKAFNTIENSMTNSIMGMMRGTETFGQAVSKICGQITEYFVRLAVVTLGKWVQTEAMKTAATLQGVAAQEAAENTGAAGSLAAWIAQALGKVTGDAGVAAAGTFAFLAPEMGPAAAGPAAAVEAQVMGYGALLSGISAYEGGGWQVPNKQLAVLHQNEMVLPSWGAQGIRDLISGGGSPGAAEGSTPNININYSPNMGGVLGADAFKGMLLQHSDAIMDAVIMAHRNFRK